MTETNGTPEPARGERAHILEANRRLHAATARDYDLIHHHVVNTFEQAMQRRDVAFILRECRAVSSRVRVLDVGCGTGNLTLPFARRGASVTALDLSAEMLGVLQEKLAGRGYDVRPVHADVDAFLASSGSNERFEAVAVSSVVHHLPDYLATLGHLGALLEPGGFLYLAHEPVHRAELRGSLFGLRPAWSILPRVIDRIAGRSRNARGPTVDWNEMDTVDADFHYHRGGVSVAAIAERLRGAGIVLLDTRHYNAHRTSAVSWLDNEWCSALRHEEYQRTYFRAIFRRERAT